MTDRDSPEVFSKYAEVLREANRAVLEEGSLSETDSVALAELVADPGWWETPPRIPDALPISAVVWLKARPVDAEGRRRNFVDSTFYEEIGKDEPAATAGRHQLAGHEYIVVYQESGPQWLIVGAEAIGAASSLASLVVLLSGPITKAVNRLRGRASTAIPQHQGGLPDTRFIRLEVHSQEGMTAAASISVDAPAATVETVSAALVTALGQPREARRR